MYLLTSGLFSVLNLEAVVGETVGVGGKLEDCGLGGEGVGQEPEVGREDEGEDGADDIGREAECVGIEGVTGGVRVEADDVLDGGVGREERTVERGDCEVAES